MSPPEDKTPGAGMRSGEGAQQESQRSVDATAVVVVAQPEQPEHRGDWRRFLIWALMLGVLPPVRVVERILAEIGEVG